MQIYAAHQEGQLYQLQSEDCCMTDTVKIPFYDKSLHNLKDFAYIRNRFDDIQKNKYIK